MPEIKGYRAPFEYPGREAVPMPTSKKHFKARVEKPWHNCHAIELWLEGDNIITVGNELVEILSTLGVEESQVTKLIEIEDARER